MCEEVGREYAKSFRKKEFGTWNSRAHGIIPAHRQTGNLSKEPGPFPGGKRWRLLGGR